MIRVILPTGTWTDIPQDQPPTFKQLNKWIGCNYAELVKVFYDGQYEQMFVDETGATNPDTPVNVEATLIYHENSLVHAPERLENAPSIYGIAVLVTGKHKS